MTRCLIFGLLFVTSITTGAAENEQGHPGKIWAEMVGEWRLTGQPKRGSTAGAWSSPGKVAWLDRAGSLENKNRELSLTITSGPKPLMAVFEADKSGNVVRVKVRESGTDRVLERVAAENQNRISFMGKGLEKSSRERWTLEQKSRDRWMILVEKSSDAGTGWRREVEVGMTRLGTTIAIGDGQSQCVVTGGRGDIQVSIGGKNYYVCCSGCREALLDDPEAFIAVKAGVKGDQSAGAVKP